jgi:glycerol kinase
MKYLLGIDQGTTQTTAVIVNEHGEMIEKNSAQLPARFPQAGWVEQEPEDIVRTVIEACAPLLDKYDISAVGFDNQGETFVVWDKDTGQAVTPAIVWQDTRGQSVCDALASSLDLNLLRQKTGLLLDSYFSAPKLKWVFENYPEIRKQAHDGKLLFGTTETWVIWKLTNGKLHVTDPSTASRTLLFDMNRFEWDEGLLKLFDVPKSMLAEVKPSAGYMGDVDFAGTGKPLPLHAMLVDQQAALFGQMCINPGMVKNTYGTGCFMLMNTGEKPVASSNNLLTTVAWKVNGVTQYALEGSVFIAGAVVQWLRDELKIIRVSSEIEKLSQQVKDTDGVYIVPAFAGLGAPHWNPYARGSIFGLTRGSSNAHIAKAALDSIAYQTYDVLKAMEADSGISIKELRVDGGATVNNELMQFQSDILNTKVIRPKITETTALGAAYLAGLAVGYWKNIEEIKKQWQVDKEFSSCANRGPADGCGT